MRRTRQAHRLSEFMLPHSFFAKSDYPRQIDRYIDFFAGTTPVLEQRQLSKGTTFAELNALESTRVRHC
jgi:hypothetical protein